MSLDINFNKEIPIKEIEEKTKLKIVEKNGHKFLESENRTAVLMKMNPELYGITQYGLPRDLTQILDELIKAFDVRFVDDDAIDLYIHKNEIYENVDLYTHTMHKYGYFFDYDGNVVFVNEK